MLVADNANLYYAVRRHLGLGVAEFDALPWWEARMLVEGLLEEFSKQEEPFDGG